MKLNKTFGVLALIVFGALVFIYFITKGPVGDSSISETFLLGNCKEFAANDNRIGMPYETSYSVATKIKGADVVAAGKKIVGVRMNIGGDSVKNCEAFIGIDYKNPTTKKSFEYKKGGWNVVIFDEPIDVTNDDIYVGYNLTATGSVLGYENANSNFEDEMLFVDGAWDTMYNTTDIKGLWSIQLIMAEGDYSSFVQNDILVESHNAALTSRVGNDLKMSCEVRNNGIKSVENIKVKCSLAGSVQEVVIPGSLINGQSYFAQFSMEAPDAVGDQKIEFSVETPDFKDENVENNIAQINHKIFALSAPERNCILIEQFTGQVCPNCPLGANLLAAAIDGLENPDRVVWLANHTYGKDELAVSASSEISQALGVRFAPSCDIDRMPVNFGDGNASLVWYPGYLTSDYLYSLLSIPSEATLTLNRKFDEATRNFTVTVSGNTKLTELFATVIVKQSGIIASQRGVTNPNEYSHNNAPRIFLTAAKGDALTIGADGNYTATYTATIPEKVGKFDCLLADMSVVAFVHGDIASASSSAVANADQLPLLEGGESLTVE